MCVRWKLRLKFSCAFKIDLYTIQIWNVFTGYFQCVTRCGDCCICAYNVHRHIVTGRWLIIMVTRLTAVDVAETDARWRRQPQSGDGGQLQTDAATESALDTNQHQLSQRGKSTLNCLHHRHTHSNAYIHSTVIAHNYLLNYRDFSSMFKKCLYICKAH